MFSQEYFIPIDAGFNKIALNKGISKGEDSVVDVLLDVIGNIFEHHIHVLNVSILGLKIFNGRLA
jgi:hypothetical protein